MRPTFFNMEGIRRTKGQGGRGGEEREGRNLRVAVWVCVPGGVGGR